LAVDTLARCAGQISGIRKADLHCGDWVLVKTKNSVYSLCALGENRYSVAGGWFDREGLSPQVNTINGCTWGGKAIFSDLVAARGLFLEFGNSVITTRIKDIQLFRDQDQIRQV
jgi:hypothetical protein